MVVSGTCPREPTGSGLGFSVSPLSSPGMLVLSVSLRGYALTFLAGSSSCWVLQGLSFVLIFTHFLMTSPSFMVLNTIRMG